MSNQRRGKKTKPKAPLHKRITPSRKFPIKGHTKSSKGLRNGDSSVSNGTSDDVVQDEPNKTRGGDTGGLLTSNNPREVRNDLKLLGRAVRSGWNIKRKNMIKRRLEEIMQKTSVSVPTKNGMVDCDGPADSNAIAAARVLVAMNGQDQADDHLAIKNGQPESSTVVNITNNVSVDHRRIELARLANKLGARELLIDGKPIATSEYLGTANTTSESEE